MSMLGRLDVVGNHVDQNIPYVVVVDCVDHLSSVTRSPHETGRTQQPQMMRRQRLGKTQQLADLANPTRCVESDKNDLEAVRLT